MHKKGLVVLDWSVCLTAQGRSSLERAGRKLVLSPQSLLDNNIAGEDRGDILYHVRKVFGNPSLFHEDIYCNDLCHLSGAHPTLGLGLGRHLWTPPDGKAFRPFPLPVRVRRPYLDMQAFLRGSAGVRVQVRVCANEANRKPPLLPWLNLGSSRPTNCRLRPECVEVIRRAGSI